MNRSAGEPGPGRAVILHVDDLGATLGANLAFLHLVERGLVTCGSVMVPGPWFMHLVQAATGRPELDIGVHLTLTSEWAGYRWAPLSTVSRASGLIDDEGYFWRDVASLRRHMVVEAAEVELRMQVERAMAAGLRPTHLDAHMAAAMAPELLETHIRLGEEYGLWPVLPRSIEWAPDPAAYRAAVERLDVAGRPVVDHCRCTFAVPADGLEECWRAMIAELPGGLTHLALHATTHSDFQAIAHDHAGWRHAEHDLLASGAVSRMLRGAGVDVRGCRDMQQRWTSTPDPVAAASSGTA